MKLSVFFRGFIIISFTLIFLHDAVSQNNKVRIAFVCQTDSVFALLKSKENKNFARKRSEYHFTDSRRFSIDAKGNWMRFLRTNLDTTDFEIEVVTMPSEVKDNYFLATYKYTNGLWHASPKLIDWFKILHKTGHYDLVLILHKPNLMYQYSEVYELNNHPSCGLIHDTNWIYSLNSLIAYDSYGGKIIAQTKLKGYNDYIRILKGADLSKKNFNEISSADICIAIEEIKKINNDMGNSVLKNIVKYTKKNF